ncbi:hypothetical protein AAFC00_005407 [Neodothiora populina]|uniref:Uncharacterized protein n=1 Tax=Neodothiora populina TaxID=2781224 RepID=A0ABR3PKZ1_9PEZI
MKATTNQRVGSLCHYCQHAFTRPTTTSPLQSRVSLAAAASVSLASRQRCFSQASSPLHFSPQKKLRRLQELPTPALPLSHRAFATTQETKAAAPETLNDQSLSTQSLDAVHARVEKLAATVLDHSGVPTEDIVLAALNEYERIAKDLLTTQSPPAASSEPSKRSTATSALLSSVEDDLSPSAVTKAELLLSISECAFSIVDVEPVFITTPILKAYVHLQSLLGKPETLPVVFDLYRSKPVPKPNSSKNITYKTPDPDKAAAAIPPAIADAAIDAAIAVRDLPLALATIETSYCTKAYKKSKFLRSALFPVAGLALTPPAAYTLANRFSDWQTTMDPQTATQVAMAGILTYTTAVATVGYTALTTANDQMVRVTWATGMPLWERWVREEERFAVDKVSQAWGFKSRDKWGEEEGEEWEELKEWVGIRGMVVDRVELMDGME